VFSRLVVFQDVFLRATLKSLQHSAPMAAGVLLYGCSSFLWLFFFMAWPGDPAGEIDVKRSMRR
jgi:hypothetical protein